MLGTKIILPKQSQGQSWEKFLFYRVFIIGDDEEDEVNAAITMLNLCIVKIHDVLTQPAKVPVPPASN